MPCGRSVAPSSTKVSKGPSVSGALAASTVLKPGFEILQRLRPLGIQASLIGERPSACHSWPVARYSLNSTSAAGTLTSTEICADTDRDSSASCAFPGMMRSALLTSPNAAA